jgi:hypothetical protein
VSQPQWGITVADIIHHHPITPVPILNLVHTIGLRKYVLGKTIIATVPGPGYGKNAAIGVDLKGPRALYSIDIIIKGVYYEKNGSSSCTTQAVGRSDRRIREEVISSTATRD